MPKFFTDTQPQSCDWAVPNLSKGLTIRAREPTDGQEIAALMKLPKIRWGTLRLPIARKDQWRKLMRIVAALDGCIVGSADPFHRKGPRRHVGDLFVAVHDDFQGRGIGSALMAALVDVADNRLDLKRLKPKVYVDNAPAIRLYQEFSFEVEGTYRGDAFPAGQYVDSFFMTRLRPGWSMRQ